MAFRGNEQGQDLAEYCLLVALVALIALGLMTHFSGGLQGIWNSATNTLATGSSSGNSSSSQPGGNAADRAH